MAPEPKRRIAAVTVVAALLGVGVVGPGWVTRSPTAPADHPAAPPAHAPPTASLTGTAKAPHPPAQPASRPSGVGMAHADPVPPPSDTVHERLMQLEAHDRADCQDLARLKRQVPDHTRQGATFSTAYETAAQRLTQRAEASASDLRDLEQRALAHHTDPLARATALLLTGSPLSASAQQALERLAWDSQDPRVIALALGYACQATNACQQLRQRWVELAPDDAAAWLAWLSETSLTPALAHRQALQALARASRWSDAGAALWPVFQGSGITLQGNGPRAQQQRTQWMQVATMASTVGDMSSIFRVCRASADRTVQADCSTALERLWALNPRTLLRRNLLSATARALPQLAGSEAWQARERQVDAVRAWSTGPGLQATLESLLRSYGSCSPEERLRWDAEQTQGDWTVHLDAMREAGADPAALAALTAQRRQDHQRAAAARASAAQPASAGKP